MLLHLVRLRRNTHSERPASASVLAVVTYGQQRAVARSSEHRHRAGHHRHHEGQPTFNETLVLQYHGSESILIELFESSENSSYDEDATASLGRARLPRRFVERCVARGLTADEWLPIDDESAFTMLHVRLELGESARVVVPLTNDATDPTITASDEQQNSRDLSSEPMDDDQMLPARFRAGRPLASSEVQDGAAGTMPGGSATPRIHLRMRLHKQKLHVSVVEAARLNHLRAVQVLQRLGASFAVPHITLHVLPHTPKCTRRARNAEQRNAIASPYYAQTFAFSDYVKQRVDIRVCTLLTNSDEADDELMLAALSMGPSELLLAGGKNGVDAWFALVDAHSMQ